MPSSTPSFNMTLMESAKAQALKHINLIDVWTYRFVDNEAINKDYLDKAAILSHRWRKEGEIKMRPFAQVIESSTHHLTDRVVDAELMAMDDNTTVKRLSRVPGVTQHLDTIQTLGLAKVLKFCRKAREDEYAYAWVDTCCIDKDNREATSKAIASMWDYYSRCARCYVYLGDVSINDGPYVLEEFKKATWFTRGQSRSRCSKLLPITDHALRLDTPGAASFEDVILLRSLLETHRPRPET